MLTRMRVNHMSSDLFAPKFIEIDLGDGDIAFVNWNLTVGMSVIHHAEILDAPGFVFPVPGRPAFVQIIVMSHKSEDICYHSNAELSAIKKSVREQLNEIGAGDVDADAD